MDSRANQPEQYPENSQENGGWPLYYIYPFFTPLNQCCKDLLALSNHLTLEMIKNSQLCKYREEIKTKVTPSNENVKPINEDSIGLGNNAIQIKCEPIQQVKIEPTELVQKKKRCVKASSQQSYQPDEEYVADVAGSRVSQSKNIPKNYAKAIINFIKKNEAYVNRVLERLGVDHEEFFESLKHVRPNLNNISQLRGLWIEAQNRFAKAYRIISMEYLRKHSLEYIFNSRVNNFHKHIKYRYRIIEGVTKPSEFTSMKEF